MSFRDRLYTTRVAKAMMSPSAIVVTGAGAALGILVGAGPIGAVLLGGRLARPRRPRIARRAKRIWACADCPNHGGRSSTMPRRSQHQLGRPRSVDATRPTPAIADPRSVRNAARVEVCHTIANEVRDSPRPPGDRSEVSSELRASPPTAAIAHADDRGTTEQSTPRRDGRGDSRHCDRLRAEARSESVARG